MKQVNITEKVNGEIIPWISEFSENGYTGKTTDTVYSDGSDTTDWNVFRGTQEECQEYIKSLTLLHK